MTLWQRTSDGFALCAGVAIATVLAKWLLAADNEILQAFGGVFGLFAYAFGFILFGLGMLMIIVGAAAHLRGVWKRRHPNV